MRIVQDSPVPAQPGSAAAAIAVLQAPRGLTLDVHGGLAGIVVSREEGTVEIATDEGVFVLRATPGLSPGLRVILTPEQGEDGIVVRLHRIMGPPSEASSRAAPAGTSVPDCQAIPPRHGGSPATLDLAALAPAADKLIGQRLPIRILAPDSGATPSPLRPVEPLSFPCSEAAIRILAITAPSNPAGPAEADVSIGSARTFAATIAARHADGAVLRADDGPILLLPPNVDLGQGTRIVFAFEPMPAAIDGPRVETPFEVIDSLIKLLGSGGTLSARSSIVRLLPRPDKALPVLAAAFLSALKGGDTSAWLGSEAGARLAHDLPELYDRLRAACSNAPAGEAKATEHWQTWTIPLLTSSGLSPLRVYRRRDDDDRDGAGDDGKPTVRVVFDCTFTRVGRVQVDTLCRKPKGCDVMIRTEAPLEPSVRDALSLAYADTAASVGLVGKLAFRAAKGAFVGPAATSRTAAPLSLSV